jgi:hypothetical protein
MMPGESPSGQVDNTQLTTAEIDPGRPAEGNPVRYPVEAETVTAEVVVLVPGTSVSLEPWNWFKRYLLLLSLWLCTNSVALQYNYPATI